jgi:hypothetical protein
MCARIYAHKYRDTGRTVALTNERFKKAKNTSSLLKTVLMLNKSPFSLTEQEKFKPEVVEQLFGRDCTLLYNA